MGQFNAMNQRGIQLNDWFSRICVGIFFFCIGTLFLSLFLSVDLNAIMEDPLGFIVLMLILTVFMDLGLILAIGGWQGRRNASTINLGGGNRNINNPPGVSADGGAVSEEQKTIRAISGGMSTIFTIYTWVQRIIGAVAALFALMITAIWWLMSILDIASGKASLSEGFLLMLGIVLISFIVIISFILLKKPRADPNAP
jgi:hypothetical protein